MPPNPFEAKRHRLLQLPNDTKPKAPILGMCRDAQQRATPRLDTNKTLSLFEDLVTRIGYGGPTALMATVRQYSCVSEELLKTIAALDRAIFPEPMSEEDFARALRSRHNLCVLIVERGPTPIGYKIGYEFSPDVFYSFSGGVLPEYRRQGNARALIREQHRIAGELGYTVVRTHTKNKYRDMLVLNIKSGFDVTGVNHNSGEKFHSIILEKVLIKTHNEGTA